MRKPSLQSRVEQLERRVQELEQAVASQRPAKDWRRTIGAFTDDPGMMELFREAMRLREDDRKKARGKPRVQRKRA
jgi:hypothetical protein